MGHLADLRLRRAGERADVRAGLRAFIRAQFSRTTPAEQARVGLAAAYAVFVATALPALAAIARWGALINLFNLTPVWQLDGGHAFKTLTSSQRAYAAAVFRGLALFARGNAVPPPHGCGVAALPDAGRGGGWGVLGMYALLIATVTALFFLTPTLQV